MDKFDSESNYSFTVRIDLEEGYYKVYYISNYVIPLRFKLVKQVRILNEGGN